MKCDFSLNHYKECIELMRKYEYKIGPVKMVIDEPLQFVLLRHDVDFHLDYAVQLAEFEHDLNISSTYFVLLHSPFYNALAPKSMEQIKTIEKLGHEIGWHVDTRHSFDYDERRILQHIVNASVETYSLHFPTLRKKPNPYMMLSSKEINQDYDIKYLSDSGRYWRDGCMCENILNSAYPRLQVLTHPIWWATGMENRDLTLHHFVHQHLEEFGEDVRDYRDTVREFLAGFGISY